VFAKLVVFECVAANHQPSVLHPDKLTVHKGSWAFCPFDARADSHEWHETGGEDVGSLLRRFGLPIMSTTTSADVVTAR